MKKILFILTALLCFILQLPSNSFVLNADEVQENVMIYKLVESDEDLVLHKKIVIVDETLSFAMIKNDARSNFDSTAILNFKENNVSYVKITNSVQTFKLGVGAIENTYSLHNDLGYLTSTDYIMNVEEKSSWDILFNETATLSNHYYINGLYFDKENLKFTSISNKNYISSKIYIECDLDEINKITVVDDLNAEMLTLKDADEVAQKAKESYTEKMYLVQGTIISINNYEYGNLTIKDPFNNTLYIYGVWGDKGNTRYDSIPVESKPSIGDNVILYGILGTHRNISEMKSSWLIIFQPHEHSYELKYDESNHSKICSICQEEVNKSEHTLIEEIVEPTCALDGYKIIHCDCGYYQSETYRATGIHPLTKINYYWSEDHLECYATLACETCDYKTKEYATIKITNPSKKCEVPGKLRYTATFSSSRLTKQIYDEQVESLPHDYQISSHKWGDDPSTCTFTLVCRNNKNHTKEIIVESKSSRTSPTCTSNGQITYTAVLEEYDFRVNYVKTIPMLGHKIITKNTGFFPGKLQVRLEHKCLNCSYNKTEFVNMFTYLFPTTGDGCKGSTSSFISIISILGLLILKRHK